VDTATGPAIEDVIALVKERIQDLNALAVEVDYFYKKREAAAADVEKHLAGDAVARMGRFADKLAALDSWTAESIHELFKPSAPKRASRWASWVKAARAGVWHHPDPVGGCGAGADRQGRSAAPPARLILPG
jgi:hypothetical protein